MQPMWHAGGAIPIGNSESVAILTQGQSPMADSLLQASLTPSSLMPAQVQQQALMAVSQPDSNLALQQSSVTSTVPVVVLPAEDQPPSDMLKAQAQTLKVRTSHLFGHGLQPSIIDSATRGYCCIWDLHNTDCA